MVSYSGINHPCPPKNGATGTAKQKLPNKENLVRFLHRGKPEQLHTGIPIACSAFAQRRNLEVRSLHFVKHNYN